MRKIYSLVLMATMLLVGTTAWATVRTVSDKATLIQEWYAAQSGDVIQLTGDILNFDSCLWLGTYQTTPGAARELTLDLNGFTLQGKAKHVIFLTRGELVIKTSQSGGTISHDYITNRNTKSVGTSGRRTDGDAIMVCGSALNDVNPKTATSGYFTHLVIEEGVTIDAMDALNGITLNNLEAVLTPKTTAEAGVYTHTASKLLARAGMISYHTNIWGGADKTEGLANGVRIDINGTIRAYQYGIKANGNMIVPNADVKPKHDKREAINTTKYNNEFASFGTPDTSYINYTPYINLTSTGRIEVTAGTLTESSVTGGKNKQALAVYASGFARWLLEGYCGGNVAVYAKSGQIDIHDAVIESTNTGEPTNPTETSSGATAQGTAIVIQSTAVGTGQIVVNIDGDTEVSATSGYAIQESVTKPDENGSYTSSVTIDGANIDGGEAGAIAVTTTKGDTYVVTVETGTIQGNVVGQEEDQQGEGEPTTTPITLSDLIENTENTHTTTVYDKNGQNPVVVVSPGAPTPAAEKNYATIAAAVADGKTTVNLTGAGYADGNVISSDLTLTELEMNLMNGSHQPQWQRVVINNNAVVKIGKVILGTKANIIVEAGSKLIITGEDGIYSRVDTNLVLRATATEQATFVIGTNVSSNRQPYATVEYMLNAGMPDATTNIWQRFSTPVCVTSTPTNDKDMVNPDYMNGAGNLNTWAKIIDDETQTWVSLTQWNQLRPFHAGALTNNTKYTTDSSDPAYNKHITYTFKGKLMGNVTDSISRRNATWNYYGNSYMAPMSTKALIDTLRTQTGMESTIWYWIVGQQNYSIMTRNMALYDEGIENLPALSFFVLKNNTGASGKLDINYKKTIFDYAINPSTYAFPAPAPARQGNNTTVRINIESENGAKDVFYLLESNQFTAEYEAGDDVEKLMNKCLNFYAADENHNYHLLATDNALGTVLSLQTTEDINYTLTFDKVRGETYALRDNMTNAVVLMNEGATYNFTAQSNATLEGRFQIVSRQEMPTAVETIEEIVNAPKAIYTIMGQYVGETTDWNNLPAGVYVVDGVKVIK